MDPVLGRERTRRSRSSSRMRRTRPRILASRQFEPERATRSPRFVGSSSGSASSAPSACVDLVRREPHRLGLARRGHAARGGGALLRRSFAHRGEASGRSTVTNPETSSVRAARRRRGRSRGRARVSDTGDLPRPVPARFRRRGTWSQTARAIAVLAHETWHLRGVGRRGDDRVLRAAVGRRASAVA